MFRLIAAIATAVLADFVAGFECIGVAKTIIHANDDTEKAEKVARVCRDLCAEGRIYLVILLGDSKNFEGVTRGEAWLLQQARLR